jgi:D-arabinose 1-dehydrogenase-like Zn-dependent alcohol dehydrogenase
MSIEKFKKSELTAGHDVRGVVCAVGHSGNTSLCAWPGDTYAECCGCRTHYHVSVVRGATPGEHGQGGVRRV